MEKKRDIFFWKLMNARICVLRVQGKFFNYSLICTYAPTNNKLSNKSANVKETFYECLDKTHEDCLKDDEKIVIGDTNTHRKGEFSLSN